MVDDPAEVRVVLLNPATFRPSTQLISTEFHQALSGSAASVKDVLAQASSVPTWRRSVAGAARVGKAGLPAGAQVLLGLSGYGGPADLAFGVGIHRCLGAGLPRLEIRVALDAPQTC